VQRTFCYTKLEAGICYETVVKMKQLTGAVLQQICVSTLPTVANSNFTFSLSTQGIKYFLRQSNY